MWVYWSADYKHSLMHTPLCQINIQNTNIVSLNIFVISSQVFEIFDERRLMMLLEKWPSALSQFWTYFSFLWHLLCSCRFFELPASCSSILDFDTMHNWCSSSCKDSSVVRATLPARRFPGCAPQPARASAWWRSGRSHWGWVALAPLPAAAGAVQAHGWHQGIPGLPKVSLEEPEFVASGVIRKEALFLLLCSNALCVGNHKE